MMPGMTGTELAKEMKKDIKLKKIPIIFLTVMPLENVSGGTNLKELGAIDYIQKPYSNDDLVDRMAKICAGTYEKG